MFSINMPELIASICDSHKPAQPPVRVPVTRAVIGLAEADGSGLVKTWEICAPVGSTDFDFSQLQASLCDLAGPIQARLGAMTDPVLQVNFAGPLSDSFTYYLSEEDCTIDQSLDWIAQTTLSEGNRAQVRLKNAMKHGASLTCFMALDNEIALITYNAAHNRRIGRRSRRLSALSPRSLIDFVHAMGRQISSVEVVEKGAFLVQQLSLEPPSSTTTA